MKGSVIALLAIVGAAGCATTPRADVAGAEAAIRDINRRMEQAVATNNAAMAAELYASDAVFMPPNMPPARGHAAIRKHWDDMMQAPNASLSLAPMVIDVAASGDLANDVGTYTFSFAGDQGRITDRGKYMVRFKKVNGEWKIASDIFNSDLPIPQPPPTVVVMEPAGNSMTMNTAAGMRFEPFEIPGFKSGVQLAVIHGDPMKSGDYTLRLKFPAGYTFPAHYHPNAEHVTVISGTFQLAMGEKEGGMLREYQPGDFLYIPAKQPHYGGARTEAVIQLHGIGPFEIKLVGMTN